MKTQARQRPRANGGRQSVSEPGSITAMSSASAIQWYSGTTVVIDDHGATRLTGADPRRLCDIWDRNHQLKTLPELPDVVVMYETFA